jgi:hypothetical protein
MRLQVLVVVLLVALAAGFVLLNPEIARESRPVQLPGAQLSAPVLGTTVFAAVGALLLVLGLGAVASLAHGRAQRRLNARLAQREHELALVKSAAYDRAAGMVEALHRELSVWQDTEGRRHEALRAQLAALGRTIETRLGSGDRPDVAATVPDAHRDAA